MKTVRLKDIAEKLKVSKTTVSRVLNNLPIRVSRENREAILKVAKSLDYRPNLIARGLRSRTSRCVGIVVPDISTLFYPELIRLIEKRLSLQGYRTIICDTRDEVLEEKACVGDLISRQVDGLIVAPASGQKNVAIFKDLIRKDFPLIFIDRYFPGREFNYVVTDNRDASRRAIRIMVKRKPSHLFYLGGNGRNSAVDERLAGVREESSAKRIPFTKKDIFLCGATRKDIKRVSKQIFSGKIKKPAIFLESNRFLIGLLDVACRKGLSVPEDFTLAGFDPFEPELVTLSDFNRLRVLKESLMVIKQPIVEMAKLVTEYILLPEKRKRWRVKLKPEITDGNA